MDLDAYWQENKRFVSIVLVGLLAFFVGRMTISSTLEDQVNVSKRKLKDVRDDLERPMYGGRDRDLAASENAALTEALGVLEGAVAFRARPEFQLGAGGAASRYHEVLGRTREALMLRAGRSNVVLDADLGQPELSPTREDEIVRHLEGLDLVDRVVTLAIDCGVDRIERLHVVLDSRLGGREGVGAVERTRVEAQLAGDGDALLEFVRRSQEPALVPGGQALVVQSADLRPGKREAESLADLELSVVRLHEIPQPEVE